MYSFARQRSQRLTGGGPPCAFDGNRLCGVVISQHPPLPPLRRLSGWPRSKISHGKPVSLCVVVHSQKKKKNYNTHASGGGISPTRTSRVRTSKRTRRRRIFPFIKTRVRRGNRIEDRRVRVDKKNKFERVVCVSETVVHPVVLFLKLFFHPRHVEPLLSSNRRCRPP